MDLNLFSKMLKELISVNDRVSVPGLGYFFVEEIPASFSDRGYTINPPYRKLSFRAEECHDGLFERLYGESNPDIPKRDAQKALYDFIAETKAELCSTKSVVLPGLGKLRATRENNLFFVADENTVIFPQYDFLDPISLRTRQVPVQSAQSEEPAQQEMPFQPEEISRPEITLQPVQQQVTEPQPQKKMSAAVIICIIVFALAVLFFAALAVLGRYFPEIIDPLLYSPEQIDIIRYRL